MHGAKRASQNLKTHSGITGNQIRDVLVPTSPNYTCADLPLKLAQLLFYGVASSPWNTLLLSTEYPTMLPELFGKTGYVPCPAAVPASGASKFTT